MASYLDSATFNKPERVSVRFFQGKNKKPLSKAFRLIALPTKGQKEKVEPFGSTFQWCGLSRRLKGRLRRRLDSAHK
jgi:hypothetical protein